MVRTPPQEDEEDDDVNLEDDPEPPQKPVRTLQTVTDVWVVTHARQVGSVYIGPKSTLLSTNFIVIYLYFNTDFTGTQDVARRIEHYRNICYGSTSSNDGRPEQT